MQKLHSQYIDVWGGNWEETGKYWKDSYGDTALMKASRHGYHNVCKWLVKENLVDEKAKNSRGWNALHLAADHNQPEITRLLLRQTSININEKNDDGDTALHLAKISSRKEEVKRILDLEIYFRKNKGKSKN